MAQDSQYEMLKNSPSEEEEYRFKTRVNTPVAKTNIFPDYEIVEVNGVEERRPKFPNWGIMDMAVGNLHKGSDVDGEEYAVRARYETALDAQALCTNVFVEWVEERMDFVRIKSDEPLTKAIALVGSGSDKKVWVGRRNEEGKLVYTLEALEGEPVFKEIEAPKGEELILYQQVPIKKIVREYLNISDVWRDFNACCIRLGLTKSREMDGIKNVNKQYSYQETNKLQELENIEKEKKGLNFFGGKK